MTIELAIALGIACIITAGISAIRSHWDEFILFLGLVFVCGFYLWLKILI